MKTNAEYQRSRYIKRNNPNYRLHGDATKKDGETSEYIAWKAMKQRCSNSQYINHHGKGIKVCDRWINNYPLFLEDMGRKPTPKHTLERIDNKGNYEPSNCKWATREEQTNNYSRNRYVVYQGTKYTAKQFALLMGIPYSSFIANLNKKLTVEQILGKYGKGTEFTE